MRPETRSILCGLMLLGSAIILIAEAPGQKHDTLMFDIAAIVIAVAFAALLHGAVRYRRLRRRWFA